jgi:hypothetical protein
MPFRLLEHTLCRVSLEASDRLADSVPALQATYFVTEGKRHKMQRLPCPAYLVCFRTAADET